MKKLTLLVALILMPAAVAGSTVVDAYEDSSRTNSVNNIEVEIESQESDYSKVETSDGNWVEFFNYNTNELYEITAKDLDENGNIRRQVSLEKELSGQESITVFFGESQDNDENQKPNAVFSAPSEVKVGESVEFNAYLSNDPDGEITGYRWEFGDGTVKRTDTYRVSHTYSEASEEGYNVKLTVIDDEDAEDSYEETIKVNPEDDDSDDGDNGGTTPPPGDGNQGPTAFFEFSPENPTAGQTVTFDASNSAGIETHIEAYRWDFGDGTVREYGNHEVTEYTYDEPGTYEVELFVKDSNGLTESKMNQITVLPSADFTCDEVKDREVVKNYESSDSNSVVDTDELREAIRDWAQGDITKQQLRYVIAAWKNDCQVESEDSEPEPPADGEGPEISVSTDPANPVGGQKFDFVATATDPDGINSVIISKINGEEVTELCTKRETLNQLQCKKEIGPFNAGEVVTYEVKAYDRDRENDLNKNVKTGSFTIGPAPTPPENQCDLESSLSLSDSSIPEGGSTSAIVNVENNADTNQKVNIKLFADGNKIGEREINIQEAAGFTFPVTSSSDSQNDDNIHVSAHVESRGEPCGDGGYQELKQEILTISGDGGGTSEKPSIGLIQPVDGTTTSVNPVYKWIINDPDDSEMENVRLYVEKKDSSSDRPWDNPVQVLDGPDKVGSVASTSMTQSLEHDTEYVWGVEADDGDNVVKSEVFSFTTQEDDDDSGGGDGDSEKPTAKFSFSPQNPEVGENVHFDATDSTDDEGIVSYTWDFDDSSSSSGSNADHSFDEEGDYDVVLTVVDSDGNSDSKTKTVNVEEDDSDDDDDTDNGDDEDTGSLEITVRDKNGDRMEDAEVTVLNGDVEREDTDSNGEVVFEDLEASTYEARVECGSEEVEEEGIEVEEGETEHETIYLENNYATEDCDDATLEDGDIEIENLNHKDSVCRRNSLAVDVTVENEGNFHETVSLSGEGLGSIVAGESFSLDPGEEETRTIYFTNVQGSGFEHFEVTATNSDTDSRTSNVDVADCGFPEFPDQQDAEDMSLFVYGPARPGDAVRVDGYVDAPGKVRKEVSIRLNGRLAAEVSTQPDGYFETRITPEERDVGKDNTVTARVDSITRTRNLEVKPTVNVVHAEAPDQRFQGEEYEVCARVESQVAPLVILEKNGQRVDSKHRKGKVCFEQTARGLGTQEYRVIAIADGARSEAETQVEVLETDVETRSFPDQIASVESGSGIVKVELYNTHHRQTRYDTRLDGIPSGWVSQSRKQVVLDPGERKKVFFYITPKDEGNYEPSLVVNSKGEEIHNQKIQVHAGGTTNGERPFWQRLIRSFSF